MIQCLFDCKDCGLANAVAFVRERRAAEDIGHWLEKAVKPAVARAHRDLSPICKSTKCGLAVPADNPAGIGFAKRDGDAT